MLVYIVILKRLPFIYAEALFFYGAFGQEVKNLFLFFEKPECKNLTVVYQTSMVGLKKEDALLRYFC